MVRRGRQVTATLFVLALLPLAAGCGDDDDPQGAPPGVPAAGELTPPSGTPGVPEDALYDVDGRGWARLSQSQRFDAANQYVRDNPERCEDADVGEVVGWVETSYGLDYPLDTAAAYVLEEGCAAALAD